MDAQEILTKVSNLADLLIEINIDANYFMDRNKKPYVKVRASSTWYNIVFFASSDLWKVFKSGSKVFETYEEDEVVLYIKENVTPLPYKS